MRRNETIWFHRAFTRADTVAGIATILLLTAVLFPVLTQKRERSGPACSTNLKQLGVALRMYRQDFDDTLPANSRAPGRNWYDQMLPYYHDARLLRCPDAEVPWSETTPRTYAINADVLGRRVGAGETGGIRLPESTVVFAETHYRTRGFWHREYRVPVTLEAPDTGRRGEGGWRPLGSPGAMRHRGGSNYAFGDGHVQWLLPRGVRAGGDGDGKQPQFGL